jgi:Flp pilus assembly protein TadD
MSDPTRTAAPAATTEQSAGPAARLRLGLIAAVTLFMLAAGAFVWNRDRQRIRTHEAEAKLAAEEARAEADRALQLAERLGAVARFRYQAADATRLAADLRRRHRFGEAAVALDQADRLDAEARRLGDPGRPPTADRADLVFAEAVDRVRFRNPDSRVQHATVGGSDVAGGYRAAFAARGWDVAGADLDELAKQIAASEVRDEAVSALDDWSLVVRAPVAERALALARRLDPGYWQARARDPVVRADPDRLDQLARELVPAEVRPGLIVVIAELMEVRKLAGGGTARLLRTAQAAHPTSFEIAFALGRYYTDRDPRRAAEFYRVARSLRRDNVAVLNGLGLVLQQSADYESAREVLRDAARLDPKDRDVQMTLGQVLLKLRDPDAAAAAFRAALAIDPTYADAFSNLGIALGEKGDKAGAVAAHRRAAVAAPTDATVRLNLAAALHDAGERAEAMAEYRRAAQLAAGSAVVRYRLGVALYNQGELAAAADEFQAAVKLDPKNPDYKTALVQSLRAQADRGTRTIPPPRPVAPPPRQVKR